MKLATFLPLGTTVPLAGEIRGPQAIAFDDGTTVLDRLATGDRRPAAGTVYPLDSVTLLAPVARPGAIYGIGLNYRAHAEETGGAVPEAPIVFQKPPTASVSPSGPIVCPEVVRRLDYEGELAIVQACLYCATAPKSNAAYAAQKAAWKAAKATGSLMPPQNILNAPTKLMKDIGYGKGYAYDHEAADGFSGANYWPEEMEPQRFYQPVERGYEARIAERMRVWEDLRKQRG